MAHPAFPFGAPRGDAAVRLVCLPFAGGSAAVFRPLAKQLAPAVEVLPLELPGRGARFGEALLDHMHELVARLEPVLAPLTDRPLALLGHSLGARVAFELARRLPVTHLFATGASAPSVPRAPVCLGASDPELLDVLRKLEGTPPEFFSTPELVQLFLPVVRADFSLLDRYVARDQAEARRDVRVDADVTAIVGTRDPHAPVHEAARWAEHTRGTFALEPLDAGHFFLATHPGEIAAVVRRALGV